MDNAEFLKKFEELTVKAENLHIAMDIIALKPPTFSEELKEMASDVEEIKQLEDELKTALKEFKENIIQEYQVTKDLVAGVTDKIFFVLNELEKEKNPEKPRESRVLQELSSPCPKLYDRGDAAAVFSQLNTPRMTLMEYAKSPLIKKKPRAMLHFSDFETDITKDSFDKIPSYIKGRITLSELQDFLDNQIIKCFNAKYELVYKDRKVLKQSEFALQNMFKDQANYFEGQKFITIGDLSRNMNKKVDKKDERLLQCLRHIHIIKEIRSQSTICYLWIAK